MMRNEYLSRLKSELEKNNITDAEDIVSEYEQHFNFKLADGFTEEEIAAKLGSPQMIAAQFETEKNSGKPNSGGNVFTKIALSFAALFEAAIYILFSGWVLVIAAASLVSAIISVCLIGHLNISGLIPAMPYLGAFVFGVCFLAFAVLLAVGAYYFFEYIKQIARASIRWHKNITTANALPPLPWSPQFNNKTRRSLRTVLLWSVTIFGASFVLSYIILALQADALEFWHVWNWFVR